MIAVAYDLEVSKNGSSHLKIEPSKIERAIQKVVEYTTPWYDTVDALMETTANGTDSTVLRDMGLPRRFCTQLIEKLRSLQGDADLALAMHLQADENGQADQTTNDEALAKALQEELDNQDNGLLASQVRTAEEQVAGESPRQSPAVPSLLAPLCDSVLSEGFSLRCF